MLSHLTIRLATRADAGAIAALSRDEIEAGLPWTWRAPRVRRAIDDPDTNVIVVGPPGAAAAFGVMYYAEDDAHLLLFAVHRSQQRRGVGSALLQWLEDAARAAGAQRIRVEARMDNEAARSFYSERGYHERTIVRRMYSDRLDGVRLEKWLRT
ncbi:GNAT family N-acetyltransferase [Scleromatobacter humisilvae]|uniref:GNAT family N-acetyltransferase n=1 Tax=Scleromatobacter humisilvae TaxID=2897159 RepID=A0A9X1YJL9_9BURK|nr:GNAT family N-acetyltransferase [Scleromatobacter humisilvae]MCK9685993.1 GNAT family N-acetyltransferase [Scleromatobacter humisilvae]